MWVFSTTGFFSITVSADDPTVMQVRARERGDLEALIALTGIDAEILETPAADYRFRIIVHAHAVGGLLMTLGNEITYCNFKAAIAKTPAQAHKEAGLHRIWDIHRSWQPSARQPAETLDWWHASHNGAPRMDPALDEPRNAPAPDPEKCGTCGHPRQDHWNRRGACRFDTYTAGEAACICSRWKRAPLTITKAPTQCPHCDYDEAEGGLLEQCPNCKAADAGPVAEPLHNPQERKGGKKSRGKLVEALSTVEGAGWGEVIESKVPHYFRPTGRSLCGKWQITEKGRAFLDKRDPIPNVDCQTCANYFKDHSRPRK